MSERLAFFTPVAVTTGTAETVIASCYGSMDQDTSIASLPTAPAVGARTVRIRGTVTVVTTGTAAAGITIRVRQGQGTGGAVVQQPAISSAATPAVGTVFPFEIIDTAPALPALNYSVTVSGYTAAGTVFVTGEIEEVN